MSAQFDKGRSKKNLIRQLKKKIMEISFLINTLRQKFEHSRRLFGEIIDNKVKIIEKYMTKMEFNQQSDYI